MQYGHTSCLLGLERHIVLVELGFLFLRRLERLSFAACVRSYLSVDGKAFTAKKGATDLDDWYHPFCR